MKITQASLNNFVEDLRATHKDNLASVVLYGSAAVGDAIAERFGFNVLVALHNITPEDLRLSQAPTREWRRLGQPMPVYFTLRELSEAADVFPIEFNQMARTRKILYGRDPFEFVKLSNENLRHQTEYELRGKLLQLRRSYIPASASAEKLSALMNESLSTFSSLFRPVLLLHGQEPPVTKQDAVRATASLLDLDNNTLERIFALGSRAGEDEYGLTLEQANALFASYLLQIERVIEAIDSIPVPEEQSASSSSAPS
jgi:pimeloyl-ACP methyl ester carboxylesterase